MKISLPKPAVSRILRRARYTYRLGYRRMGRVQYVAAQSAVALVLVSSTVLPVLLHIGRAAAIAPGGDTVVVDPSTEEPISILENSREPESPNIRIVVPSQSGTEGFGFIRILSVTGGTLKNSGGGAITLGDDGDTLDGFDGRYDFWFTPAANRNIDASFEYMVVDTETWENSDPSTVTVPITPVDVAPTLKTANGFVGTGLTGTYYREDYNLTGPYSVRLDPVINFDSAVTDAGLSTVWDMPNMNSEDFSVRWTGQIKAPVDGNYSFQTISDDGVRLWIDGENQIDNWTTHGPTDDYSQTVHFTAGSTHDIELDYYERGGGETILLSWSHPGTEGYETVPTSALYPGTIRPQLTYLSGSPAVFADDSITIGDVDSLNMTSATVSITGNYQAGEDFLQFSAQNGITGVFNSGTGVLTLSGTASIANYQAAMRSVKYFNGASVPNTDTRTIHFIVNDGEEDSNYTSRDIVFSDENSPPEIIEGESVDVTMDEDGDPTPFSLELNADDPNFQTISWSIASQAEHGTASVDSTGQTVNVHYTPQLRYSGTDSFVVQASDSDGGTDSITVNVTINPNTDNDGIPTETEDAAPHNGDANNDGIADSKQSNVTSFVGAVDGRYVSLAVDDSCELTDVGSQDQAALLSADDGYTYPLGLLHFTADCGTPGFTTTVTQYYYNPPAGNFVVRKYLDGSYQAISTATVNRATIGGQPVLVVSYEVTDGGTLDADGTEDGVIVDPAGPAKANEPESENLSPNSNGGGVLENTGESIAVILTTTAFAALLALALRRLPKHQ